MNSLRSSLPEFMSASLVRLFLRAPYPRSKFMPKENIVTKDK